MDQADLINYVADALDRHRIPYAITGSHASNIYGETRFTNDVDLIIPDRNSQRNQLEGRHRVQIAPSRELWFVSPEVLIPQHWTSPTSGSKSSRESVDASQDHKSLIAGGGSLKFTHIFAMLLTAVKDLRL